MDFQYARLTVVTSVESKIFSAGMSTSVLVLKQTFCKVLKRILNIDTMHSSAIIRFILREGVSFMFCIRENLECSQETFRVPIIPGGEGMLLL